MRHRKYFKRGLLLLLAFIITITVSANDTYAAFPDGYTTKTNSYSTGSSYGDGTITLSYPSKIFDNADLPVTVSLSSGSDVNYLEAIYIERWTGTTYVAQWVNVSSFNSGGTLQPGDSATYYLDVDGTPTSSETVYVRGYKFNYSYTYPEIFPMYESTNRSVTSLSESMTFEVVSGDNTPPVISGGSYYYSDVEDPASLADIKAELTASDETDGNLTSSIVIHSDGYSGNEDTIGEYTTRWKVTDAAGNIGYKYVYVRVVDVDDPVITLSGSSTVYIEYGGGYSEPGYSVSDNYDTNVSVTVSGSINTNSLGTYYKYYNAEDSSGNTATQRTRTIIVRDTTRPVINVTGSSTVYVEYGDTYNDAGATWSDAVDGSGSANSSGTVNTSVLGSYTITYSYTDSSGNSAYTKSRTVVVQDTTAPNLSLNGSSTVYVALGGTYTEEGATYSDNVDGTGSAIASGTVDTSTLGSYTITYSYTDSSGNAATSITRTVIVEDQTKPTLTLNGDSTIYVEYNGTYSELGAVFNDNVDGTGDAVASGTVDTSILGSYTITYTYTDANGNVADEITRTVVVEDSTKPILALNGDSTVYVALDGTYTESGASWTDNYDGSGTATVSGTVDTSTLGSYTITYSYTDSNGNVADTITRTVIVEDQTKPTLTLNGDSTVYVEYNGTYSELGAVFNDNVDGTGDAVVTGTVDTSTLGSYTITYNYTDANGNVADEMTRTVVVEDSTSPTIILIGDPTIHIEYGDDYTEQGASWTDNYDGSGTANVSGTVDVATLGTYTITYTFTDSNGNVAESITRTVIVEDTTSPYVEGDLTQILTFNSQDKTLGEITANIKVFDLYDGDLTGNYTVTTDEFTAANNAVGSYTVTISATDSNGNIMNHSFTIEIKDDVPPVVTGSSYLLTETEADAMTQEEIKAHIASKGVQ